MKRALSLISLCALALSACQSAEQEPIKIGFIGPLTGGMAGLGMDILHGAQIKLEEINSAGEVDGRPFELITEDGRCTGADAASAAQKLVHVDKVVAIHGGECSGETLAAAPIAEAEQVVMLSPSSSHPDITDAGDFIFRDYPNDALKTRAMAQYFIESDRNKVAIITENADFTVGFRDALKKDVGEDAVVFDELVEPDTRDFRTLVTRLKDVDFDVLVININSPAGIAIALQQAREQGLEQLAISHDVGDSVEVIELAGDLSEGFQVINVPSLSENSAFGQKFVAKYGQPQANLSWGGYGYDVMGILLEAISEAGTEGPAIRDYLYDLKSYKGVVATVSFDENGDVLGIPYALKEVQDGTFVTIEDIEVN